MTRHEERRASREVTLNHRESRNVKYAPAKLNVDRLALEMHGKTSGRAR